MDQDKLHRMLADLHRELSGAGSLDEQSRRMLEQVLADVRQISPAPGPDNPHGPAGQVRDAALRLEAEHPRLAAALGQVADALAKVGI